MAREGIMLCYPFEEKRLLKWKLPYIIQPKLDGDRCRAFRSKEGEVTLLSSENKIRTSVPHIQKALQDLNLKKDIELDGELYCHGMSFPEIHSRVSRTVNLHPNYKDIRFHIFDLVTTNEQYLRLHELTQLGLQDPLVPVQSFTIQKVEELDPIYNRIISQGYEGIILRKWQGFYTRKRSTEVMKLKPRKEDSYLIIGVKEERTIYGEPKGRLGSLICTSDGKETFDVGSGPVLTAEGRKKWWDQSPVGKILQVKYQDLFESGSPRFPVAFEIKEVSDYESREDI